MIEKDESISAVLAALALPERGWAVVQPDPWEGDLMAIAVSPSDQPRRLVYISTYERAPGRFYFQCETPNGPDPTDYVAVDEGQDVDFDTLLAAMNRHLSVRG